MESYADMDTFTFESILPNGECVGIGCSRRLDFRSDVDWCLVFANTGVPSLNFMKLKAEDAHFTYEFQSEWKWVNGRGRSRAKRRVSADGSVYRLTVSLDR